MCNKIAIIIKLKLFLIVFTLNFSFFSFGQNEYVQGKWLVILDGHKEKSETIKSSEKYEFPTIILHSDNYENLNPSWYIVTIPFDDKDDAIEESKKLKNRGINCYVKYSGFLKSEKITLEESVKFIISGKYIVIDKLSHDFSFTGRNHELIYRHHGTPVDLLSEINIDEIPQGVLPWQKNGFSLISIGGNVINNVKIIKFYILSRIQIETYRPTWCFEAEDPNECIRGNYPENKIKKYIWDREKDSRYLIAEIDNSDGVLAVYNERFIPKLYNEIDYHKKINSAKEILDTLPKSIKIQEIYDKELPQSEKNETVKWYNHKYAKYDSRMFVLESDTLFFMSYNILDNPCGGYIEESGSDSWRIKDGKFHKLRPIESDFDYIFRFENIDNVFIYKYNHNTNSLFKIDEYYNIDLPYNFIDPWEC